MAKPARISVVPLAIGTSASPGAQSITVPSDAQGVVVFARNYSGAGAVLSLSSNFAGTFTIVQDPSGSERAYVAAALVTSTGSKTITPAWSNVLDEGPIFFVAFYKDIPTASVAAFVRDMEALSSDASGDAVAFNIDSAADDEVIALDSQYNAGAAIPALDGAGWTSVETQGLNGEGGRLKVANTPGSPTTTVTAQGAEYRSLAVISLIGAAGGDTTAPTLTSPTGAATGSTTASGSVTTDEANGTLYRVTTTNASESAATVKAGASQAVTATGVQNMGATGLTASTTYRHHYLHRDAAGNDSAVVSSATFTTDTPDTTAPTLSSAVGTVKTNALIEIGATTNEANGTMYAVVTTSATPPSAAQVIAGQNNGGTAAVWAGNQAIGSTGAKTFNATGLTQLTGYYPYIVHRDAANNSSSVLSVGLRTTFRDGATAQYVLDNTGPVGGNPAGTMYAVAGTIDPDDWMAYRTISGPTPGGGTLTEYVDGRFTYVGGSPAVWEIQIEINGVDHSETTTVNLYDQTLGATFLDGNVPHTSTEMSATQTNQATFADGNVGHTSTEMSAVVTQLAQFDDGNVPHTSTEMAATQTNQATFADGSVGYTSTQLSAVEIVAGSGTAHGTVSISIGIGL